MLDLTLCSGAITTLASIGAYNHLKEVRQAALVTKKEKTPDIINQRTEDAIKIETLGDLFDSPNHDIRQAAVKILVERVMRDDAYDMLLSQIRNQNDVEGQTKALLSLRFLIASRTSRILSSALLSISLLFRFPFSFHLLSWSENQPPKTQPSPTERWRR